MNAALVSSAEYFSAFPHHRTVFSSQAFIENNAHRADKLRFIISTDNHGDPRLGIIIGLTNGTWNCPFSAPFGEIAYNAHPSIERLEEFFDQIKTIVDQPLSIRLAPPFYDPIHTPLIHGVFANKASKTIFDFNYHYDLSLAPHFSENLTPAARNKFNKASRQNLTFITDADPERAYAVIAANRAAKGYPLAMSLSQVMNTVSPKGPVQADFFILAHNDTDIAAAMVYHVAPNIAQVIYWGDSPGFSNLAPMNILPYHIFAHYHEAGYSIVDIGPASSNGIPNIGLCSYKESIGCSLSLKPTFLIS